MQSTIMAALLAVTGATAAPLGSTLVCAVTLTKAHVFTGDGFETRDISLRDGRFVAADKSLPQRDAAQLWLIPPLVDAHTHSIDTPKGGDDANHRRWLSQGVFYALNPDNIRPQGPTPPPTDSQVDFQAAGGGLTRPGGHPAEIYADFPGGAEGKAYYDVANPTEARAAVARVKANGAAFVKLYLLNHDDPGGGDGLSAASFDAAVAEAKRLGLRPIVHIEDADDFRLAVAAKVFAIMHMPYWPPSAKPQRAAATLMIDQNDADAAAQAGIIVVPTVILSLGQFDGAELAPILAVQRHDMASLRVAKVRMAVGEDFIGDMHDEIAALRSFGLFESAEMLRMATENGAALAFPGRKLGRLADGYDASFLVYRRNPIRNWISLRTPVAGMRAGHIVIDQDGLLAGACLRGGAPGA